MVMMALLVVQLCALVSELADGGYGWLVGGTSDGIGGDCSGLVGSTASCTNLLFMVYLAQDLV